MLTFKEDANLPGKFRAFKNRAETGLFIVANSASEAEDIALDNLLKWIGAENELDVLRAALAESEKELAALKEEKGYAQLAAEAPAKKKSLFKRRRR